MLAKQNVLQYIGIKSFRRCAGKSALSEFERFSIGYHVLDKHHDMYYAVCGELPFSLIEIITTDVVVSNITLTTFTNP